MSDPTIQYNRARATIENDLVLNQSQKLKLVILLDRFIKSEAFVGKSTKELQLLLKLHGNLVCDVDRPAVSAFCLVKPVYACKLKNEFSKLEINNCTVLIDSGNTAVDLVLPLRDCHKFGLFPSEADVVGADTYNSSVSLTQMLPNLLMTFSLRDSQGTVTEKKASLDVYCNTAELEAYSMELDPLRVELSPPETPEERKRARGVDQELQQSVKKAKGAEAVMKISGDDTDLTKKGSPKETPVNDPSPVRHVGSGTANLGDSGIAKLMLIYDSSRKQLSFLAAQVTPEV